MRVLLLLPALIAPAAAVGVPDAVEMAPGVFVLKGAPSAATFAALKGAHVTHLLNLRMDGERGFSPDAENAAVADAEVTYLRLALPKAPSKDDLDFLRSVLNDLPRGMRLVVHCDDGNRAAAVMFVWLVLDRGMDRDHAWALAQEAGLAHPATEKAVRAYVAANLRS